MRILIACECSGRVRNAFRKMGHEAYSCDLKEAEDHSPFHIIAENDIHLIDIIAGKHHGKWDMVIAHPECRYLCSSGMHWTTRGLRDPFLTEKALALVKALFQSPVQHLAIENPIGIINTKIRKADQIIQPYYFGEDASKQTCLWLKNLPLLRPTEFYPPRKVIWKGKIRNRWGNQCNSGQNILAPSKTRSADRARTYQGIADAMATQWGDEKILRRHMEAMRELA